ncbi:hypothetical protein Ahy_B01g053047 [Arachis hypogaea]|uniref:Aminotransferase-like plant mobile domain-containing protein n=1 Tax=Arachis hypogaea TaxID=3818 RepID=A0A445AR10_ARAHY|nr:hypothetical protein Ahy_B01g053047 [Arachis hypogaea]
MEQQLLGYENTMYKLDQAEHIVGRLDRVIRSYLRQAGFEYLAYIVEFEHDWPLASALIERWKPESHTFNLPCEEMTITLQDMAYQLGLRIDGEPTVTDQVDCEAHLVPQHDLQRTGAGRHRGVLVEVHERVHHAVDRGYPIPYASDYRVHIRWLPLLKDLETCGGLSWGSTVLAWLYRQMCRATEHGQRNMGGWVQYRPDNAKGESRLRHYRHTLNGIGLGC